MTSLINFLILISLIICAHWFKKLEASRQVVVTCGSDEAGEKGAQGAPGSQGPPGKRGPIGVSGSTGEKGLSFQQFNLILKL